jgi:AraC-like DNA-binding protein
MVTATMPGTRGIQLPMKDSRAARIGRQATKTRARNDSLPEFTRYRDDGCEVSSSCLSCPLPRCRYEEPGGLRAILNESRDREIIELRARGVSVDSLAGRFGVSRRTVFRVLGTSGDSAKEDARRRKAEEDFEPIPISYGAVSRRPMNNFATTNETRREANCA